VNSAFPENAAVVKITSENVAELKSTFCPENTTEVKSVSPENVAEIKLALL